MEQRGGKWDHQHVPRQTKDHGAPLSLGGPLPGAANKGHMGRLLQCWGQKAGAERTHLYQHPLVLFEDLASNMY